MKAMRIRRIVVSVLALVVLLLGGGYAARQGYLMLRQARLLKQAHSFVAQAKPKKALLCLQRVLRSDPKNIEAGRLMADIAGSSQSPAALIWRSRVVDWNPNSIDDRLALAETAMVFHDLTTATNALEGLSTEGKGRAAYHNLAGALASLMDRIPEAESHFQEALRLEPSMAAPSLNLALLQIRSTNETVVKDARATLGVLATNQTNATVRCQALRELVADAIRARETNQALALGQSLASDTNATFTDRLIRVELLRISKKQEYASEFENARVEAESDPVKIHEFGLWQLSKLGPTIALDWLLGMPMHLRTNQPAALLIVKCQVTLQDWAGLLKTTETQDWGDLNFLRHAFQSRGLRGQELNEAAKAQWELALKTSNNQKASLVMLLGLAASWNWNNEGESVLWKLLNRYPDERWAFNALTRLLHLGGRTRALMMLLASESKRRPSDFGIKNDLAMTALLLDAKELKPYDIAREVYEASPTNAVFASTYALSLHLMENDSEALKVMRRLKEEELEIPAIAAYYGLFLRSSGDIAASRRFLDLSSKASLLPEEKKLMQEALKL